MLSKVMTLITLEVTPCLTNIRIKLKIKEVTKAVKMVMVSLLNSTIRKKRRVILIKDQDKLLQKIMLM